MLLYHALIICFLIIGFGIWLLAYKAQHQYDEVVTDFKNCFQSDFEYTLDLIRTLTPKEADRKIDEFEGKWIAFVSDREMKICVGKMIEAMCERESSFS